MLGFNEIFKETLEALRGFNNFIHAQITLLPDTIKRIIKKHNSMY